MPLKTISSDILFNIKGILAVAKFHDYDYEKQKTMKIRKVY
jgi:hypothetical protein